MMLTRAWAGVAVTVIAACSSPERRSGAVLADGADRVLNSSSDSIRTVGVHGADTVYLESGAAFNSLVWRRRGAARVWRADSLYSAEPESRLALVDRDSLPDLFFTIRWEEFITGELWLARETTGTRAFKSADDACRVPELRDVNGDGALDVVDTDWPEVWIQGADGQFARDSVEARGFFGRMALEYAAGASSLRTTLQAPATVTAGSPRCNANLAKAMEQMARRAEAISLLR